MSHLYYLMFVLCFKLTRSKEDVLTRKYKAILMASLWQFDTVLLLGMAAVTFSGIHIHLLSKGVILSAIIAAIVVNSIILLGSDRGLNAVKAFDMIPLARQRRSYVIGIFAVAATVTAQILLRQVTLSMHTVQ